MFRLAGLRLLVSVNFPCFDASYRDKMVGKPAPHPPLYHAQLKLPGNWHDQVAHVVCFVLLRRDLFYLFTYESAFAGSDADPFEDEFEILLFRHRRCR
jgi:hypothetical protein